MDGKYSMSILSVISFPVNAGDAIMKEQIGPVLTALVPGQFGDWHSPLIRFGIKTSSQQEGPFRKKKQKNKTGHSWCTNYKINVLTNTLYCLCSKMIMKVISSPVIVRSMVHRPGGFSGPCEGICYVKTIFNNALR